MHWVRRPESLTGNFVPASRLPGEGVASFGYERAEYLPGIFRVLGNGCHGWCVPVTPSDVADDNLSRGDGNRIGYNWRTYTRADCGVEDGLPTAEGGASAPTGG